MRVDVPASPEAGDTDRMRGPVDADVVGVAQEQSNMKTVSSLRWAAATTGVPKYSMMRPDK